MDLLFDGRKSFLQHIIQKDEKNEREYLKKLNKADDLSEDQDWSEHEAFAKSFNLVQFYALKSTLESFEHLKNIMKNMETSTERGRKIF